MGAFGKNLIHKCTIRRPATTDRLDTGEQVEVFEDSATDVPCRYVVKQQKVADETTGFQVRFQPTLLLPAGTEVFYGDQVVNLLFEHGYCNPGPFRVEEVLVRRDRKRQRFVVAMIEKVE